MFISNIFNKINSYSTLNIQSKSIHNFKYSNFKKSIQIESFYLQNILKLNNLLKLID